MKKYQFLCFFLAASCIMRSMAAIVQPHCDPLQASNADTIYKASKGA